VVQRRGIAALALLLLAAPATNGCSTATDPCAGVTCGGFGFCLVDRNQAYCACIRGYHPEALRCVANDATDPCRGVDCSGHGNCWPAADGLTCDCEPGYRHLTGTTAEVCRETECDLACILGEVAADGGTDDARPEAEAADGDDRGGCDPPLLVCGGECVDPATDPDHCGACDAPCDPANGAGACFGAACLVTCDPGWTDANGSPVDGCEYACTRVATAEEPGAGCENGLDDDCDGRADGTDPDCADCVPELCNGLDDDCDGLTDEDYDVDFDPAHCGACGRVCPARPHAGAACSLGVCDVTCAPGWEDANRLPTDGCEAACVAGGGAESACDGVDDDCDGLTDEEFVPAAACGDGPCRRDEACLDGAPVCRPRTPPALLDATCDGFDDDCDGAVDDEADCACATAADCDDGNPCTLDTCGPDLRCSYADAADGSPCPGGLCCGRACAGAGSELCNGRDDDCDGATDEDFACRPGGGVACTTSCGTTGFGTCSTSCTVPAGELCPAPAESCNGLDDDCDTACDETFECCLGGSAACTTGTGAPGVRLCGDGCTLGACTATADPCNGADDDGNTVCDDGLDCCRGASESRACTCGGSEVRVCDATCGWGAWSGCSTGACFPGASESRPCTCGGSEFRSCRTDCSWGDWSGCAAGSCSPGASDSRPCACGGGSESRTCLGDCDWGPWSGCPTGVCTPGESQTRACLCGGTEFRTCNTSCMWNPWSGCATGECTPLAVERRVCTCGADETRTCSSSCSWGGWTGCTPGACVPGEPRSCTTSCGTTGSGTCSPTCQLPTPATCTPPPEACNSIDDDCDGATDEGFTIWRCPLTGTTYPSSGACNPACTQSAVCNPAPLSLSGSVEVRTDYSEYCSPCHWLGSFNGTGGGLQLTNSYESNLGSISLSGFSASGGATFRTDYSEYCSPCHWPGSISGSGSSLVLNNSYGSPVGTITLSGATASGTIDIRTDYSEYCSPCHWFGSLTGSGQTLTVNNSYGSPIGSIAFSPTGRICPLDAGLACGGSPASCSRSASCTELPGCP
jgi:hypothetical protein